MKRYPIVFSIAGSDCTGGAGIQADIKTISALGAYAATALTGLTVQNTMGIKAIYPLPAYVIREQFEAVMEDMWPDVVKIGLINDAETAHSIGDCLRKYHPEYVVFDSVMLNIDGERYLKEDAIEIIKKEVFPFTNLIMMSIYEAETLTGMKITSTEEMVESARTLAGKSRMSVFIKGRQLNMKETHDILCIPSGEEWLYQSARIETANTHGCECTLSAAIATYLALGIPLNEAVLKALEFIDMATKYSEGVTIGRGTGPICQTFDPQKMHIFGNSK